MMRRPEEIEQILNLLTSATSLMAPPAACEVVRLYGKDPFLILISCILSLRTKDTVSLPASIRLFQKARTALQMSKLSVSQIVEAIYPVGFYRRKAEHILEICCQLLTQFNGSVPATKEQLLSLKGVGFKTANLVLSVGFDIPALCVDTHVHRIAHRLGLVETKTPAETEDDLKKIIPRKHWSDLNRLLVMWGQNQCVPISPFCSTCPLKPLCPRRGVGRSR